MKRTALFLFLTLPLVAQGCGTNKPVATSQPPPTASVTYPDAACHPGQDCTEKMSPAMIEQEEKTRKQVREIAEQIQLAQDFQQLEQDCLRQTMELWEENHCDARKAKLKKRFDRLWPKK